MCRLFGISYGEQAEKLTTAQIARILFPALTPGGPHAYGWMQNIDDTPEGVLVRKYTGRADAPNAAPRINSIRHKCRWFVGHTRFATHGTPELMCNNHPVRHGNIIGVHNGVLRNHEDILSITGREDPTSSLDSEAIFAAVNRWGHKGGLTKVHGNMVAIYADFRKLDTLWIARSYGRHLRIGWTKRGNLIFASEQEALDKLKAAGIEFEKFSGVSENRLLTVVGGDIASRITYRFPAPAAPIAPYRPVRTYEELRPSIVGSTPRMAKAKQAMEAADWHRPHYSDTDARRVGISTREAWDRHPLRLGMIEFLDEHADESDVLSAIADYLDRVGFLSRVQTMKVIDAMTAKLKEQQPVSRRQARKLRKQRRAIPTATYNGAGQKVDADTWVYKGRMMSTDQYLAALSEDVMDAKDEWTD